MKRLLLALAGLAFCASLWAQDYIHQEFYGQGADREGALRELLRSTGQASGLKPARLIETYRADISGAAVEEIRNGKILLHLKGTDLDAIFQARQNRTAQILQEGRNAADPATCKTFFQWARYYLYSLPPGHQLPGKEEVETWLSAHENLSPAPLPVPMTHIQRETDQIRHLLEPSAPAAQKKTQPASSQNPLPEEKPVRKALFAVPAAVPMPLGQIPGKPVSRLLLPERQMAVLPKAPSVKTSLMVTAGLAPEAVLGATVNVKKHWGIMAGFQSNFRSVPAQYTALKDGSRTDGEGFIWPNGESSCRLLRLYAGVSYGPLSWLDVFATAGYGHRLIYWQDTEDAWVQIQDQSTRGPAFSCGTLAGYRHLAALFEVSTISFQTLGVSIGVGVRF